MSRAVLPTVLVITLLAAALSACRQQAREADLDAGLGGRFVAGE